jgi:PIN domain nuclease of toxin-antitoxin system
MILDTCALLFLASGDRRLSRSARDRLQAEPVRWFCAISAFEIALKHRQGKLGLPFAPLRWLRRLEERYALTELALDSGLCTAVADLPRHHGDPFDRFIIAAASACAFRWLRSSRSSLRVESNWSPDFGYRGSSR